MDLVAQGNLLIAEPFMEDGPFKRAVILLCQHNEEHTIGFILNKVLSLSIKDLETDFPDFDAPVFFGGPCESESTLHYLHNVGDLIEESIQVMPGIWWGGNYETLKFLIETKLIEPHNIRFFLGYSGWEPNQLKDELDIKSWIVADGDSNYVFNTHPNKLWELTLKNKGNHYSVISDIKNDAHLN